MSGKPLGFLVILSIQSFMEEESSEFIQYVGPPLLDWDYSSDQISNATAKANEPIGILIVNSELTNATEPLSSKTSIL